MRGSVGCFGRRTGKEGGARGPPRAGPFSAKRLQPHPGGISAEGKSPKEVIGILGESATFLLESPSPFDTVLWLKNEMHVAVLGLGPPCQLKLFAAYENRDVTISQDCRSLTVRGLCEEDTAGYRAQILNNLNTFASQTFTLKVYKRLSESDVKVSCAKETLRDGNKTWHVNCSVGKWEDGVDFSWTAHSRSGQISASEKTLVFFDNPQDKDWKATCVAKNPVGNASRTFSLQQACATEGFRVLSGGTIGVTIAALIVAKVIINGCVFATWPHCTK
ncbi:hypothetical protein lerEdw1_010910 [Lerista edwardsae]|nr:hypothetical protein lerEdw1_010910 [Lerista edwardsae]